MTRLNAAPADKLEGVETELDMIGAVMGFTPNSVKTMAHRPGILRGFMALAGSVLSPDGVLERGLKQMIAHIASSASGCRYCQAHTSEQAHRSGISPEKIQALWMYETSDLFSDAERAALALAQAGASTPNEASQAHFDALRPHFSDEQIAELVAVIALFGFLNRWNDTLATPLEDTPLAFAEAHLSPNGWTPGAHK